MECYIISSSALDISMPQPLLFSTFQVGLRPHSIAIYLPYHMAQETSATDAKSAIEEEKANMEPQPSDDVEKALGDHAPTKGPADQQEYPPMRKVIVIMLSLYMATFLISLVSYKILTTPSAVQADKYPGSNHHCHRRAQ